MKITYISFLLISILLTVLLTGCDYDATYEKLEQPVTDETEKSMEVAETTEIITDNPGTIAPEISNVELNNTYTTHFGETNLVTYPAFSIDYPDGWTITSNEVNSSEEKFVLTNEAGTTITYWYFGTMRDLSGPTRKIETLNVTRMADANFIPGYVQGTDYSDLGKFMVAKLETFSECNLLDDGESVDVEYVRYALLPGSSVGEQSESFIPGLPTFSFWYAGHISLIATTPNEKFTEQEEQEVIAILSSFRVGGSVSEQYADDSSSEAVNPYAATIDELWAKLEGVWTFEEYIYMDKSTNYTDHTLEFQYIDNIPCMNKELVDPSDTSSMRDTFFYDYEIVVLDEYHYYVYYYRKGEFNSDESANWSDDMQLVWYSFDLSNLSDGELSIGMHMRFDNGFIYNHIFRYRLKES